MSTTVTYKGSTLTTVNNQTRTLKTAGKYMEGDIILTNSNNGSITWETIYDETATIVSDSPNYVVINNWAPTHPIFVDGQTWRVTWNGTEYICSTKTLTYQGSPTIYIGNAQVSGFSDTSNEPFLGYMRTSTQLAFVVTDSAGSITLKMELQHDASATLIEKTITANGVYSAEDDSADGYSNVTVNVSNGVTVTDVANTTGTTCVITTGSAPSEDIPLNTQLIDFTAVKNGYIVDGDTGEEIVNQWSSCSDFTLIDPTMTFSYIGYQWYDIVFYDTSKNYISKISMYQDTDVTITNDYAHGTLTPSKIPSTAKYVRIDSYPTNPSSTLLSLIRTA